MKTDSTSRTLFTASVIFAVSSWGVLLWYTRPTVPLMELPTQAKTLGWIATAAVVVSILFGAFQQMVLQAEDYYDVMEAQTWSAIAIGLWATIAGVVTVCIQDGEFTFPKGINAELAAFTCAVGIPAVIFWGTYNFLQAANGRIVRDQVNAAKARAIEDKSEKIDEEDQEDADEVLEE